MRGFRFLPLFLVLISLIGPADARPGGGGSMGSRGSHTWSAPPRTSLTPNGARPFDRTATPSAPSYQAPVPRPAMPYGSPAVGAPWPRHPFLTGFAGGLLGAGLFGLLSGHGFFGGAHGLTGLLGFLIQVAVIGWLIVLALRFFASRRGGVRPVPGAGSTPVTLTRDDYLAFQRLLLDIQNAWSSGNLRALSTMATPEMVGYFNEQLSNLASRGARNIVSDVRFLGGDLSEAWREGNLTYATVAMRYSMIDVTTDSLGNVIDGSSTEPVTVTELWTFVRADGRGNWVLSAIQQPG